MMEAGGDVSESDSMAIERLMAEPDKVEVEDDENSMDEIEITASNCHPTADVASNNNHVSRTTDRPAN